MQRTAAGEDAIVSVVTNNQPSDGANGEVLRCSDAHLLISRKGKVGVVAWFFVFVFL